MSFSEPTIQAFLIVRAFNCSMSVLKFYKNILGRRNVAYGIRLLVWGDRALFTRPEMKVERVSYDVMTPSAARGIVEAIHWKPAIRWVIDRIQVLKPIRFDNIRRNEVASKVSASNARSAMKAGTLDGLVNYVDEDRQQRASTVLKDVEYQ